MPGRDHQPPPAEVDAVAELLAGASSALFVTGAGLSADSGLPTYRGIGGLYEDAVVEEGMAIEEALSGTTFLREPALAWKYIAQVEAACRGAQPNRGHQVLASLEKHLDRACVLTQNVDGFHRRAGSRNVIEIHGSVHELRCPTCPWRDTVDDFSALEIPPACPRCADVIRPDVVLFGEMLPEPAIEALSRELERGFDVVFSIGTSSLFPYIAQPVVTAGMRGVPTVEINPTDTFVSPYVAHRLRARAAASLDAIWKSFARGKGLS